MARKLRPRIANANAFREHVAVPARKRDMPQSKAGSQVPRPEGSQAGGFVRPRIPPPVLALLAAGIMWAFDRWLPLGRWIPRRWNGIGLLPAALGFAALFAAFVHFRQAGTTVNPMDPAKATLLVTSGVFGVSRNPMYLGLLLLLAGWAVWLGSASVWLIPPLFAIAITCLQIIPEERALERLFGPQYTQYRRRVARWI